MTEIKTYVQLNFDFDPSDSRHQLDFGLFTWKWLDQEESDLNFHI